MRFSEQALVAIRQGLADYGFSRDEIDAKIADFNRNPPLEWIEATNIAKWTIADLNKQLSEPTHVIADQR